MTYFRYSHLPIVSKIQGWGSCHGRGVRADLLTLIFKLRTTALSPPSSISAYLGFSYLLFPVLPSSCSSNQITFQDQQNISDRFQRILFSETTQSLDTQSVETIFYMRAIYFLGWLTAFPELFYKVIICLPELECIYFRCVFGVDGLFWHPQSVNCLDILFCVESILSWICLLMMKYVVHWGGIMDTEPNYWVLVFLCNVILSVFELHCFFGAFDVGCSCCDRVLFCLQDTLSSSFKFFCCAFRSILVLLQCFGAVALFHLVL